MADENKMVISSKDITSIQTAKADDVMELNELVTDATQQVARTTRELELLESALHSFNKELNTYNEKTKDVRSLMMSISKKL